MLVDDVAAVMPGLRAHAEGRMRDTVRFTRADSDADPTWNDSTGEYDDPTPETVYEGKCRVRQAYPAPQVAESGEAAWAVDRLIVSLPMETSGAVVDGCQGTILTALDAAMVDLRVKVQSPGHYQTDSTARRLPCLVVSRDA